MVEDVMDGGSFVIVELGRIVELIILVDASAEYEETVELAILEDVDLVEYTV